MKRIAGYAAEIGGALVVAGTIGLAPQPASAGDRIAPLPPKGFSAWQPLTTDELAKARAGEAVANNTLTQTVANTLEAQTVNGGAMTLAPGAIAHNSMTVNILNTGNNVTLQAGAAFIVNLLP
jgi:hypothetical protein